MKRATTVRAFALIYVLFITTIIALLCSFLLLRMAHAWQLGVKRDVRFHLIQSNENLKRLALSKHFDLEKKRDFSSNFLYPDVESQIESENWGIFPLIRFKSKTHKDSLFEIAFLGLTQSIYQNTALYLVDNNLPLSVSGDAQINGDAYLPASGIRSGVVEGRSFKGKVYVQGTTYKSLSELPEIKLSAIESLLEQLDLSRFETGAPKETIDRSFKDKPLLIDLGRNAYLENCELKGKVMLQASESIIIANNAKLEDVILMAPRIEIEKGSKISGQLLATEAIHIQNDVLLSYPSLLYLNRADDTEEKIQVESGSKIEGLIIAEQGNPKSRKPLMILEKDTEVLGLAYVNGILELQGQIKGALFCENLQYSGKGSLYLSYLVDSKLDNNALPKYLSLPDLFGSDENKSIIKWLD